MARLLWVSTETPDRTGQGGQRRQYHQIRSLTQLGHDITVVVPTSTQDDTSVRDIATVVRPKLFRMSRLLRGRLRDLHDTIASPEWDAVVVAHTESEWLLPRDRTLPPVLIDMHNVLSRWYASTGEADRAADALARERSVLDIATAVSTCSEEERRRLVAQHPDAHAESFAAPLGIDPAEWPDVPFPRDRPRVAMFGAWDWQPNARGLEWFATEVWPAVRAAHGDAEALVAGSGVGIALPEGMTAVGRVKDLAAFCAAATVVAVPVLQGVGASVKFAESLATGAAVIATPDGANAFDADLARVSDDPDEWIAWIGERLDRRAEEAAPHPARRRALTELTWAAAVAPIDAWLRARERST